MLNIYFQVNTTMKQQRYSSELSCPDDLFQGFPLNVHFIQYVSLNLSHMILYENDFLCQTKFGNDSYYLMCVPQRITVHSTILKALQSFTIKEYN